MGSSGECPICHLHAEDVRHLLFQCSTALEMWNALGISAIIDDALHTNRSGSTILKGLIRRDDNTFPGMSNIGLKETIIVACWYLWWMRRQVTHDEVGPPMN